MTDTITTGGLALDSASQVPAIRTFQIDPSGLGGMTESVNLYRGDITVPMDLVSFQSLGGLEVRVSMVYGSNVDQQVDTWNLEAPTGPLGLGWSMGHEFIAIDNSVDPSPNNDRYYLIAEGASNRLFKTAETEEYQEFETENFRYWRIRYFPRDERWEIVKEEGNTYVYGGTVADLSRSPVQYGVRWGLLDGNWIGSSVTTLGQHPFALGWNLSEIRSTWGHCIGLEYDNDVLTLGGDGGRAYTRSSRLVRVHDPAGRTFSYHYREKVYDPKIREYTIPHINAGTPSLRAYQDRFETRYLDHIDVTKSAEGELAGELILRLRFSYELRNVHLEQDRDPDLFKRYLTQVDMETADGLRLPNFQFSYHNREEDRRSEIHRGALREILYPQGGRVAYDFAPVELSGTDRHTQITNRGIPRVWFGPDYTVVTHYDGDRRGLEVRIRQWNGLWTEAEESYQLPVEIDLATLQVTPERDFFALSFHTQESQPRLFVVLIHKEKGRYGVWVGEDQFTALPIGPNGRQGISVTGENFVVAVASGGSHLAKVWDRQHERWIDRSGDFNPNANGSYALAASRDYFALATYRPTAQICELEMYFLESRDGSFQPFRLQTDRINDIAWDLSSTPNTFWAPGLDFAVMTYVVRASEEEVDYAVRIQQWNALFQAEITVDERYTIDAETRLPFTTSVASGNVVGNLGHLFRFDGLEWQREEIPIDAGGDETPRLLYGSDAAMLSSSSQSRLYLYDPYRAQWRLERNTPGDRVAWFPTANGEILSLDREVYRRTPTGELMPIANLDPTIKPRSLVNRAPFFLAYEDQAGNTHVLPLVNGEIDRSREQVLPNQHIYVPGGHSGTHLTGAASLMTYEGDDFDNPTALWLYRFVNRKIEGRISSFLVAGVKLEDGMPSHWGDADDLRSTRFFYDCDNVTVTPDGSVSEIAAATAVYELSEPPLTVCYPPPQVTPFGRSEYRYHNNRAPIHDAIEAGSSPGVPVRYYSYLTGQLFDKTDFDAHGEPKQREAHLYEVRTEREPLTGSGSRVALYGAFVKPTSIESTQYEEVIEIPSLSAQESGDGLAVGQVPEALVKAFAERGVTIREAGVAGTPVEGQFRLYPDPSQPFFLPVSCRGENLIASIGVLRRVRYEYSLASGLLVSESTESTNSQGLLEFYRQQFFYAWQVEDYAILRDRHILSPVALSIRFAQAGSGTPPGAPTQLALTTYGEWFARGSTPGTHWAPVTSYEAVTAAAYDPSRPIPVDFDDWMDNDPPPPHIWRRMETVIERQISGRVLESLAVDNTSSAYLMNRAGTLRLAEITNARRLEVSYLGFEPYESDDGWTLGGGPLGDHVRRGDAHTGEWSLALMPSPETTLDRSFRLAADERAYILSYWLKTPEEFDLGPGEASWRVEVDGQTLFEFPMEGTGGAWKHRHHTIRIGSQYGGGDGRAAALVSASNAKTSPSSEILFDDLFLTPLASTATATVHDSRTSDVVATLGPNGATVRPLRDARHRQMGTTTADGRVESSLELYLVRQQDSGDPFTFPSQEPNSLLEMKAADGGELADLTQGEGWKGQWSSGQLGDWTVEGDRLLHSEPTFGSIEFTPTRGLSDYGFRVSVIPPVDANGRPTVPSRPLGLSLGDDLQATWHEESGWTIELHGELHLCGPMPFASEWLLIAPKDPRSGETAVFFFADGRLVFSRAATAPVSGAASLFVEDQGVAFTNVATAQAPRLARTFLDGSGKERQSHRFTGTGVVVAASLYDPVGRAAVGVKKAEFPGLSLALIADFVDSFDPVSGLLTGRAAEAYPEDEGYPYLRTEFYPSAQSLPYQQGLPGKSFAIDGEGNPHVTTYTYGTNSQGQFGSDRWPANEYFVTRTRNANGDTISTLTTRTDQKVAEMSDPTTVDGEQRISHYFYDGAGRLVRTMPPAGVAAEQDGDPNAERWATTSVYNFLGQEISTTSPDTGTVLSIYDPAGRIRFALTAEGGDPQRPFDTILYTKYDGLGREIEQGWFEGQWNRDHLEKRALEEPAWPDDTQLHTWKFKRTYDGDGTDPLLFGQLSRVVTRSENSPYAVRESFAYDLLGRSVAKTVTAEGFDTVARTISLGFSALGETVRIDYPEGGTTPRVTYRYDRLGQVHQIGTPGDPAAIATYSYNALGLIEASTVQGNAPQPTSRTVAYNPPGWPNRTEDRRGDGSRIFGEELTYTEGGAGGAAYYDGTIASASTESAQDSYLYRYRYDRLTQLTEAENTADPNAGLTIGGFDPNGNVESWAVGETISEFALENYTNRLDSISIDGEISVAFSYDRNGSVTSASNRHFASIAYDRVDGLTRRIDLSTEEGSVLTFDYGGNGDRVVKTHADGPGAPIRQKLYVRDVDDQPLLETTDETTPSPTGATQFIYGPDGLVAIETSSGRCSVIRDRQGSVRRVVDSAGEILATFDYNPFGVLIGGQQSDNGEALFYRYTGQEYDEETGLYNYRARLYDPQIGRFLGADPAGQFPSSYAYVGSNPINLVDPDGRAALTTLITILVSTAIGAVVGAGSYLLTPREEDESFSWGKFFLYTGVGAGAGFLGSAVGLGVGAGAAAGLAKIGASTAAPIASGIVVGAAGGAAEGAVFGGLNQIGENLLDDNDETNWSHNLGWSALLSSVGFALLGGGYGYQVARAGARAARQPAASQGLSIQDLLREASSRIPGSQSASLTKLPTATGLSSTENSSSRILSMLGRSRPGEVDAAAISFSGESGVASGLANRLAASVRPSSRIGRSGVGSSTSSSSARASNSRDYVRRMDAATLKTLNL